MAEVTMIKVTRPDGTTVEIAVGRICMGPGGEHSPRLTRKGKPVRCFWCGVAMDAEGVEVRDGRAA
jgi:hypothetical protein